MMSNSTSYRFNLSTLWCQVVEQHANKNALLYSDGTQISFKVLHGYAKKWTSFLINKGLKKGDVVAIANLKAPESIALMIACINCGIIYTNLDSSSPEDRLQKMLDKAKPKLFFAEDKTLFSNEFITKNQIQEVFGVFQTLTDEECEFHQTAQITGSDPVYIMFTSGSTGFPKGALMSHRNVLNLIQWSRATYQFESDEILTNVNPIYFDNSVFDFYSALFNGLTLAIFKVEETKNPLQLVNNVDKLKCTSWFSVPSMLVFMLTMRAIHSGSFNSLKRIIFGGEGFPKQKLKQLYDIIGQQIELYNVYGPTECTCICSSHQIVESDFNQMNQLTTLGFIAPNFDYAFRINDRIIPSNKLEPGVSKGELLLKGPNVGLGYVHDEERTKKSFLSVFENGYIQRYYTTGDLMSIDEDGKLHFKGRVDNQIKHMGYRIELEEIESAFSALKQVHEVGVIQKENKFGQSQIVAIISIHDDASVDEIKVWIKKQLPPYMIPKEIKVLDTLPKNANGKIDRKTLKELI